MKEYYIDLRSCEESERSRIMKIIETCAWDVYLVAKNPNVRLFAWDRDESVNEIPGIPNGLISEYPPRDM